ncbi:MAG TPA: SRPBCC domain-containing protein [Thermoanaerobaculia bacterium]|nr:SRPBCC domain-containing protein [Thermoanaerobaculia bacterium]
MTSPPEIVRKIEICAPRETVFRYFTDPARFAAWWGEGSTVDPRPGGRVAIRYPNGQRASGVFREIAPPGRVVFTFGNEGPNTPIPPGGSTVIVTLEESANGTLLTLRHTDLPNAEIVPHFLQGWRYQLSVFSRVVAAEQHAGAAAIADAWFEAWNAGDAASRRERLEKCAVPGVAFADAYGVLAGYEDVEAQIAATKIFMPGKTVVRAGEPLLSHGHALVRWEVRDAAGAVEGRGTNAIDFAPDGRILRAVGFWGP